MIDDTQDLDVSLSLSLPSSPSIFAQMGQISRNSNRIRRLEALYSVRKLWLIQVDDAVDAYEQQTQPLKGDREHAMSTGSVDKGKRRQTEDPSGGPHAQEAMHIETTGSGQTFDGESVTDPHAIQEPNYPHDRYSGGYDCETIDAIRMSLGEDFESDPSPPLQFDTECSNPNCTYDHASLSCKRCARVRKFSEDASKFKLVQSDCPHFLAVSYCWPKHPNGEPKSTPQEYQYRKVLSTGESKAWNDHKPPDHVVRRALTVARALDIRQIWIDKVCASQDQDDPEHQLAIQAIDFVYRRAFASVGLLESTLTDQRLLAAYSWSIGYTRMQRLPPNLGQVSEDLVRFLDLIVHDPFNQRAWILQECISGGGRMILALQTAPGVDFPPHPTHRPSFPQPIKSSILFSQQGIRDLGGVTQHLCSRLDPRDQPANYFIMSNGVDSIWPSEPRYENSYQGYYAESDDTGLGQRSVPRCTAALAVTYIRRRKNHSVSDRLAIMANVCNYEVRLDTRKVQDFPSLAVAYITQALMNGDFSLCIPELINTSTQANGLPLPASRVASIVEATRQWDSHWCPHPTASLPFVDSRFTRPRSLLAIRNSMHYWITETGLRCPATIRQVQEQIDLRSVRDKWLSDWNSMKCVIVNMHSSPHEQTEWTFSQMNEMAEWAREHRDELVHGLIDPPDRYKPYISCKLPSKIESEDRHRKRAL